jgi:hypothetical protein
MEKRCGEGHERHQKSNHASEASHERERMGGAERVAIGEDEKGIPICDGFPVGMAACG